MPNHEETAGRREAGRAGGLGRLGDVAVGTLVEAEEVSQRVFGVLGRGLAERRRMLSGEAASRGSRLRGRILELAERGSAERVRARERMTAGVDAVVTAVSRSPVLAHVVDAQLDRVLRPLVDVVLDEVLDLLEREPDRIRALVRSQRNTMVDELVGRVRAGAAAGDDNVDRLTSRVLHQSPAPSPPGEPR